MIQRRRGGSQIGDLAWLINRLRRMSAVETCGRFRDELIKLQWRFENFRPKPPMRPRALPTAGFELPRYDALPLTIGIDSLRDLRETAERLMAGEAFVLGETSDRLGKNPDWFIDIRSGKRAPDGQYCFDIPYRESHVLGEIKYIWEPSRHHHLTVIAAAYYVYREERFAQRIERHLRSWWTENRFLRGVHWTSGIEIGMRLIAWVWLRRLLAGWPGTAALFERNRDFCDQLYWHQAYLAALPSRGSSANNHRVAEAAGLFAAATAFPIFEESARWRSTAAHAIETEIVRQSFPDGLNRELATSYHGLTLELFLVAGSEDNPSEPALAPAVWRGIAAMVDAVAAMVDRCGRPPRQGDDDGAFALVVDGAGFDRWRSLLATGEALFGRQEWWPHLPPYRDLRSALLASRAGPHLALGRSSARTNLFAEGGMVLLRDIEPREDELWCRCDHGPLGFLGTAAHGHADALSLELRLGGTDILSDPGTYTYSYHDQDGWRDYFRSTRAHNTLELDGVDQCRSGGPFLWLDRPRSTLERLDGLDTGSTAEWVASHDGYERLRPAATHRRAVRLDRRCRSLEIVDSLSGAGQHRARLFFHLGPQIGCRLEGTTAYLEWLGDGCPHHAVLYLPTELQWHLHSGETKPILGWYSAGFGLREPSFVLVGRGLLADQSLVTRVAFGAVAGVSAETSETDALGSGHSR
jgi:Heparinase II/III-like protein/Heparinase II/III N-terminus